MKAIYSRWLIFNLNQLMRHTAVAVSTWLGTGFAANGTINWRTLWIAIAAGAFFPTIIAFLSGGIPSDTTEQPVAPAPKEDDATKT